MNISQAGAIINKACQAGRISRKGDYGNKWSWQRQAEMRSFDPADAGIPGHFCLTPATLATVAEAISEDTRKIFRKLT